jgi:hypothetical protein
MGHDFRNISARIAGSELSWLPWSKSSIEVDPMSTQKQQMSTPFSDDPDFYTRAEAAGRLRMSLATFDRRVRDEKVPVTKRAGARGTRVLLTREQMFFAIERRRRGEI